MKRARQEVEEEEDLKRESEDTETTTNARETKLRKKVVPGEEEEDVVEEDMKSSASLGLECVGDDALLHVMELCGPVEAARAFLVANRRLHALVSSHRLLWRRAYTRLFTTHKDDEDDEDDRDDEDEDDEDGDEDHDNRSVGQDKGKVKGETEDSKLQQHLAGVEDYFAAYSEVMREWSGEFEFLEDGVPLAEGDCDLTIQVDAYGRAAWEGYGVGCGRAGEYTSLNCLKGKGHLQLRLHRKGVIEACVKGYEDDLHDTCERLRRSYDDDDDDSDDDDDDDDDEDEAKQEERRNKEEERKKRKEEKRKERAEKEGYSSKWVEESLKSLKPPFFGRVTYKLHVDKKGKWCTGGAACASWHYDMEW